VPWIFFSEIFDLQPSAAQTAVALLNLESQSFENYQQDRFSICKKNSKIWAVFQQLLNIQGVNMVLSNSKHRHAKATQDI
jgi:hypothetical protein